MTEPKFQDGGRVKPNGGRSQEEGPSLLQGMGAGGATKSMHGGGVGRIALRRSTEEKKEARQGEEGMESLAWGALVGAGTVGGGIPRFRPIFISSKKGIPYCASPFFFFGLDAPLTLPTLPL